MRDTPGIASLSNSSRLPLKSLVSLVSPVIFPPGCAKLSISPSATGSPVIIITMGIVLVACLAARIPPIAAETNTSTLSCTSSAAKPGRRSPYSLSIAILDKDAFPLNITEIPQPLPECILEQIGIGGRGLDPGRQKSYPRNFARLLGLSCHSKSKQHHCNKD